MWPFKSYGTLKSPLGKVITYGVFNDTDSPDIVPNDPELLLKTAKAYWEGIVDDSLISTKLEKSRKYSEKFYTLMYERNMAAQYPEVYFWKAVCCIMNTISQFHTGKYLVPWCDYIWENGSMEELHTAFSMYLHHAGPGKGKFGDIDKIISWCCKRAEKDQKKGDNPVGLLLLRHYLTLKAYMVEPKVDSSFPKHWKFMEWKYGFTVYGTERLMLSELLHQIDDDETYLWLRSLNYKYETYEMAKSKYRYEIIKKHENDYTRYAEAGDPVAIEWMARNALDREERKKYADMLDNIIQSLREEHSGSSCSIYEFEKIRADKLRDALDEEIEKSKYAIERFLFGLGLYAEGETNAAIETIESVCSGYVCKLPEQWMRKHGYIAGDWGGRWDGSLTNYNSESLELTFNLADEAHDSGNITKMVSFGKRLILDFPKFNYDTMLDLLIRLAKQDRVIERLPDFVTCVRSIPHPEIRGVADELFHSGEEKRMCAALLALACNVGRLEDSLTYIREDLNPDAVVGSKTVRQIIEDAAKKSKEDICTLIEIYAECKNVPTYSYVEKIIAEELFHYLCHLISSECDSEDYLMELFETKRYFSRWFKTDCWLLARQRLEAHDPAFCAKAYSFSGPLELERREIMEYLQIAKDAGYPVGDLLETFVEEIHEERREYIRQLQMQAELEERKQREREEAIDRKFDELERTMDMLHGGNGRSFAERVIAGEASELDRQRLEDIKNEAKNRLK